MPPEEKEFSRSKEENNDHNGAYTMYDDATLEKMRHYFKQQSYDELLKFIKSRGIRRYIDLLEDGS